MFQGDDWQLPPGPSPSSSPSLCREDSGQVEGQLASQQVVGEVFRRRGDCGDFLLSSQEASVDLFSPSLDWLRDVGGRQGGGGLEGGKSHTGEGGRGNLGGGSPRARHLFPRVVKVILCCRDRAGGTAYACALRVSTVHVWSPVKVD